jgi:hypothetical protein
MFFLLLLGGRGSQEDDDENETFGKYAAHAGLVADEGDNVPDVSQISL